MSTLSFRHSLSLLTTVRRSHVQHRINSFLSISDHLPEFDFRTRDEAYQYSLDHSEEFWGKLGRSRLDWKTDFTSVCSGDFGQGTCKWFEGGTLNASVNCLDRHLPQRAAQPALLWERDELGEVESWTYADVAQLTNRLANLMRKLGVRRGDRVAIYLPTSPLAACAMLACARIGAVHSVVFAGFSAEALAARITDADARTVITCDQAVRGGRPIELKRIVDDAVAKCPNVRNVLVGRRTGVEVPLGGPDLVLSDDVLAAESTQCEPEWMGSEDPLYMLYTSGSTGKPKGLVHTHAGYLLYTALTNRMVFDVREGDVFGCMADIGWITGHSHAVYGPLMNGFTSLLFESTPVYPDPGRYWSVVERLRLTQLYTAPTAIRLLIKYGDEHVTKYDRSSLRCLATVGEPINHEAWEWFYNVVGGGRTPVVDTWWQTETGGVSIAPTPCDRGSEVKPSTAMRPFFGIEPLLLDETTKAALPSGAGQGGWTE